MNTHPLMHAAALPSASQGDAVLDESCEVNDTGEHAEGDEDLGADDVEEDEDADDWSLRARCTSVSACMHLWAWAWAWAGGAGAVAARPVLVWGGALNWTACSTPDVLGASPAWPRASPVRWTRLCARA